MNSPRLALPALAMIVSGLLIAPSGPGRAALSAADARHYRACVETAGRAPEQAFEEALEWRDRGGGVPARHCAALALVELGRYQLAAERLEEIANDIELDRRTADQDMRAEVLGQAGNAWLLAAKPQKAYLAFSDALIETPDATPHRAGLLIDRARALAEVGDYIGAVRDLDQAARIDRDNAEIYAYRASARRALDSLGMARADVERALVLDADNIYALLERGNLRSLAGDIAGARADWTRILSLAPGTPAADAARSNIQKLALGGQSGGPGKDEVNRETTPPLLLDPSPEVQDDP